MNIRRLLVWTAMIAGVLLLLLASGITLAWWYFHPEHQRQADLIYGTRNGENLTLDVFRPAQGNGYGVILMASGGWKSESGTFPAWRTAPLMRRGYTVFVVYHVPQPRATVMEITADVNRAVRYIRAYAPEYGIHPGKLGVTGASSGGHLSLMLATLGGPGQPDAADPVERESSAVQAVAIFYPVTDLLNLGASTENRGDGGPPKSFVSAFGPQATNLSVWRVMGREISPIYHISSNLPPTLIYHGDADTLVPLDQSLRYQAEARKQGGIVEVVVHPQGGHGWGSMILDLRHFAAWFDRHLRDIGEP